MIIIDIQGHVLGDGSVPTSQAPSSQSNNAQVNKKQAHYDVTFHEETLGFQVGSYTFQICLIALFDTVPYNLFVIRCR
jgi:hypothetical protein